MIATADLRQKFLRQMLYHDYYRIDKPTNPIHIGEHSAGFEVSHTDTDADHCIDNLRQNLSTRIIPDQHMIDINHENL